MRLDKRKSVCHLGFVLLALAGCGGASQEGVDAQSDTDESVDAPAEESAAIEPATSPTTSSSTTTSSTSTTTIPGPRWDFDASFNENIENLVGAPVDPLFQSEWDRLEMLMSGNNEEPDITYWATYVGFTEASCMLFVDNFETAVDENWTRGKVQRMMDDWAEALVAEFANYPGFETSSRDHRLSALAAGIRVHGCDYEWDALNEFVGN